MTAFVSFAARRADEARADRGVYVPASVAARLLGLSARTIRRHVAAGTLAGRQLGRQWYVYRDALRARLDEARRVT